MSGFELYLISDECLGFWDKPLAAWLAIEQLSEEFPEFDQMLTASNMKRLTYWGQGTFHIASNTPIRKLDDFEGVKVRCSGGMTPVFEAVATAINLPGEEIYDSLQKGMIDASTASMQMMYDSPFKIREVAKYLTLTYNWGNPSAGAMINLDAWNKLSPDVQQVFMELREEYPHVAAQMLHDATEETYTLAGVEEMGVEIIELPAEDIERWKNLPAVKSIPENWVKRTAERRGLSEQRVQELLDRYIELCEEYGESHPLSW
jgi:TRAP-type C4-dicarboxylate transport system substrate-binding protein